MKDVVTWFLLGAVAFGLIRIADFLDRNEARITQAFDDWHAVSQVGPKLVESINNWRNIFREGDQKRR